MSRRYSQINRGAEYKKALDNKLKYESDPKRNVTKRIQGGQRKTSRERDKREVFLKPFGIATIAGTFAGYSVLAANPENPANAKFKENIVAKNRLILTVNDQDAPHWQEAPKSFKPAKVTIFILTDDGAEYVEAKKTKLFYLKYNGKSHSCVFGANNDTEEFAAGAKALKNDFRNDFKASKHFRISVKSEVDSV